jgi:hypothetical protein
MLKKQLGKHNNTTSHLHVFAAEEVAHTIVFVSKMPFMVGSHVQIDGGYTAA